jgi:16S rRNA U1498 N3-methylase RsmE
MIPAVIHSFEQSVRLKNRLLGVGWHKDAFRHFGPGGLDEAEKVELKNAGFIAVSLGPGILRFETAGAAGVAIARGLLHHAEGARDGY